MAIDIVHLQEGVEYSQGELAELISSVPSGKRPMPEFIEAWAGAMNESLKSREDGFGPVKTKGTGLSRTYQFNYVGLYNFVDKEGAEICAYFAPKFLKAKDSETPSERLKRLKTGREQVLLAIDRYFRESVELWSQESESEESHLSLLGLAVQVLRDYLENGLYVIHRHELETNGNGEIDWDATIDRCDPFFSDGKPVYVDCLTASALPDEDHYITRLHKCLISIWGRKFEELGLSSVLRVNVPMLSEDELTDAFGEKDCILAEIRKELSVQFVTKSRRTLQLMAALVEGSLRDEALAFDQLSFGMTHAEHLWERAVKTVFGNQMDRTPKSLGLLDGEHQQDVQLSEFIHPPKWKPHQTNASQGLDEFTPQENEDEAEGARLRPDFIAVEKSFGENPGTLAILDAKYYLPVFDKNNSKIRNCPGVGDIDKQFLYQFAYAKLCEKNNLKILNAFVFPFFEKVLEDKVRPFATISMDLFSSLIDCSPEKQWLSPTIMAFEVDGIALLSAYADGRSLPHKANEQMNNSCSPLFPIIETWKIMCPQRNSLEQETQVLQ